MLKKSDRIKIIETHTAKENIAVYVDKGDTGTIIRILEESHYKFDYGIEFDKKIRNGHSCGDAGKHGYCLWVTKEMIGKLVETKRDKVRESLLTI